MSSLNARQAAEPTATVADILDRAADLIEPEGAWTQGTFGRDVFGSVWDDEEPEMPSAVCWCALGSIAAVTEADPWMSWLRVTPAGAAMIALQSVLSGPVAPWNDAPERTQAEVVAALRQAASAERAKLAAA